MLTIKRIHSNRSMRTFDHHKPGLELAFCLELAFFIMIITISVLMMMMVSPAGAPLATHFIFLTDHHHQDQYAYSLTPVVVAMVTKAVAMVTKAVAMVTKTVAMVTKPVAIMVTKAVA
eukprot:sb/3476382/